MKCLFRGLLAVFVMVWSFSVTADTMTEANVNDVFEAMPEPAVDNRAEVIELDEHLFIEKVFDFRNNEEWSFKGDRPAIIDFYAVWCGPCKRLAPVLVELQKEYGEKIQIYKVDAEKNRELAAAFGVTAYPTMLFIPMDADPAGARGLLPKEELERIIGEFLKVEK